MANYVNSQTLHRGTLVLYNCPCNSEIALTQLLSSEECLGKSVKQDLNNAKDLLKRPVETPAYSPKKLCWILSPQNSFTVVVNTNPQEMHLAQEEKSFKWTASPYKSTKYCTFDRKPLELS
ncbi:uncharacterized protein LOC121467605 [Drosophila elegans]|uniref:uncharacterized protein LOC121467605 n=1 Tax=Drosophila elegans TaxID=30023 RepID=UPI001BC83768|nr:uncharacterized protein LOC121467605 [Drosophila elegans]